MRGIDFCCCFLIKGGFLLHSSGLSVVVNVAVGPVQMSREESRCPKQ